MYKRILSLLLALSMLLSLFSTAWADETDLLGDPEEVISVQQEEPTRERSHMIRPLEDGTYSPALSKDEVYLNLYGVYKDDDGYYCDYTEDWELVLSGLNYGTEVSFTTSSSNLLVEEDWWYEDEPVRYYYLSAKKSGTYTVTFDVEGTKLTCTVHVFKLYFKRNSKSCGDVENKKWDPYDTALALYKGETTTLELSGVPEGVTPQWSTGSKSIATVSSEGEVTAKGYGQTTITASIGDAKVSYIVVVSYKNAIKALRYCVKNYNSTYSQEKRMKKGYYDCSSFVWRAYKESADMVLGSDSSWASTAANMAKWCVSKGYMIYEGPIDGALLLPGDLVFETGENNGRYKGIYHVDMAQGNGKLITVARTKYGITDNIMVARPCGTKVSSFKAAKESKSATKLSWGKLYKPTGYAVYRSTKKSSGFKKIGTTKTNSYSDSTNHKKTYYYKVRPYWKKNGHTYYGKYSSVVKFK